MDQLPSARGGGEALSAAGLLAATVTKAPLARQDRKAALVSAGQRARVWSAGHGWVLAAAAYLALAIGMWWDVWAGGHPASTMTCACGDPASFAWFLDWPAYALTHGHSLLLETRDQVPSGMNMLDNTSVLALGVVLAPVTWLAGPILTLNVALTAAPALSGLSAYGCLRRGLGLWPPAAFLAGLLFGFSPFVQRNQTLAHLQVTFLALVPLIFLCCYEITVAQRGKSWRWGMLLGLLVAVQFFIGSEILTMVALTAAGSAVLALATAAVRHRDALRRKLPYAVRGLSLAVVLGGALLAYPVWFAIAGPDHITGSDWATVSTNSLDRIVLPLAQPHEAIVRQPFSGYLGPAGLSAGYLGIPAILVVLLAAILVRRPLSRLLVVIMVIAEWASLGAYSQLAGLHGILSWLPSLWQLVQGIPVLDQATPLNFPAMAVFAAAVSAALLTDWIWRRRPVPSLRLSAVRISRPVAAAGCLVIVAAALVASWAAWSMPYTTRPVGTPPAISRLLASLPANAVVLFYPYPSSALDKALVWQARDGMRFAVAGGRGITAGPGGAAVHGLEAGTPAGMLSALTTSYEPHGMLSPPPRPTPALIASMRKALRYWGVTNVIMAGAGRDPGYARQWLTAVLGVPPHVQDGRLVWTSVQKLIA